MQYMSIGIPTWTGGAGTLWNNGFARNSTTSSRSTSRAQQSNSSSSSRQSRTASGETATPPQQPPQRTTAAAARREAAEALITQSLLNGAAPPAAHRSAATAPTAATGAIRSPFLSTARPGTSQRNINSPTPSPFAIPSSATIAHVSNNPRVNLSSVSPPSVSLEASGVSQASNAANGSQNSSAASSSTSSSTTSFSTSTTKRFGRTKNTALLAVGEEAAGTNAGQRSASLPSSSDLIFSLKLASAGVDCAYLEQSAVQCAGSGGASSSSASLADRYTALATQLCEFIRAQTNVAGRTTSADLVREFDERIFSLVGPTDPNSPDAPPGARDVFRAMLHELCACKKDSIDGQIVWRLKPQFM